MGRIKIVKTVSLENDDVEYVERVAGYLTENGGKSPNFSETLREIIRFHKEHPANKKGNENQ